MCFLEKNPVNSRENPEISREEVLPGLLPALALEGPASVSSSCNAEGQLDSKQAAARSSRTPSAPKAWGEGRVTGQCPGDQKALLCRAAPLTRILGSFRFAIDAVVPFCMQAEYDRLY